MEERKVTIKDIAEELGLSTATVSNVIHGKTKKISDRTVAKVQEKLQESGICFHVEYGRTDSDGILFC